MALQVPGGNRGCRSCVPSCGACGERLVPGPDGSLVCVGCVQVGAVEVDVSQLDVFEEDPDFRPYLWDLQE